MITTPVETLWYRALNLSERAESAADAAASPTELDDELVARWRDPEVFADDALFRRRLAELGLDERAFESLVARSADELGQAHESPPDWLAELHRCLNDSSAAKLPAMVGDRAHESVPFLTLVEPLIADAYQRLLHDIDGLSSDGAPFDRATAEILFDNLPGRLAMILRRTLVLELNIARLQGLLDGADSKERFNSFIARIAQPDIRREILGDYPVLARQLMVRIDQWRQTSREFLRHLADDWPTLRQTFWPSSEGGRLVRAKAGVGDSHRGGRSVVLTEFSDGSSSLPLVYKPRSLEIEERFNDFLRWLNGKGFEPAFRTLTVVNRGDHGWVEKVEQKSCENEDELRRFYQRQGGFLAILYMLNAGDFHFENIIASGEHPVLVDLETLFHPRVTDGNGSSPELRLPELLQRSVLGPGLLPNRSNNNPEKEEGVDLSGLSPVAGQETWKPVLGVEKSGTDEMHFAYGMGTFPETHHHPSLTDGRELSAADYTDEIRDGFVRCYRLLMENRSELLDDSGPIQAFAGAEIRVVFRATLSYAVLLAESFHPDVLQDALERDLVFDRLWKTVAEQEHMARLISAEQRDLWRVDVPIFNTRVSSRDLWTSDGERLSNYFGESGLDMVRRTVENLGEEDLKRQDWLVKSTLTTLAFAQGRTPGRSIETLMPSDPSAERQALGRAADEVAQELHRLAWVQDGRATWFTFNFLSGHHWNAQPAPPDLYDGLAGIAYFLAYHGAVRSCPASTTLARQAMACLQGDLDAKPDLLDMVGAMNGWGSLIHTYVHLAALWSEPQWLDEAEALVPLVDELLGSDQIHDIVGGAAGCLVALLELYDRRPAPSTLAVATRCGERLVAQAQAMDVGLGWILDEAGATPLAGFSHGTAGIAWALLLLAEKTGDARFRETALGAIAYERGLFSDTEQNWPDLREGARPEDADAPADDGRHFICAWCHGASGITLGRLLCLPFMDDAETRREIEIGLETTRATGFSQSDCLCHGNLGNLDVLLLASEALNDPALEQEVYQSAAALLPRVERTGWRYGIPGGMEPPGLMVGLAGFGYQLLRLSAPDNVPSILALAPPPG